MFFKVPTWTSYWFQATATKWQNSLDWHRKIVSGRLISRCPKWISCCLLNIFSKSFIIAYLLTFVSGSHLPRNFSLHEADPLLISTNHPAMGGWDQPFFKVLYRACLLCVNRVLYMVSSVSFGTTIEYYRFLPLSESDEESDEGESNHFSYTRNREWKAKKPGKDAPSKLCFCLKIGQGSGTLFCHVKVSW